MNYDHYAPLRADVDAACMSALDTAGVAVERRKSAGRRATDLVAFHDANCPDPACVAHREAWAAFGPCQVQVLPERPVPPSGRSGGSGGAPDTQGGDSLSSGDPAGQLSVVSS